MRRGTADRRYGRIRETWASDRRPSPLTNKEHEICMRRGTADRRCGRIREKVDRSTTMKERKKRETKRGKSCCPLLNFFNDKRERQVGLQKEPILPGRQGRT
jgi:hypothetical protein